MRDQFTLDLGIRPLVKIETEHSTDAPTIQERFTRFHRCNPWVLAALEKMAIAEMQSGFRTSVDYLVHNLRWHYRRTTRDPNSDFKISNDYTSRYARLLLEKNPSLHRVIKTKTLTSK